MGPTPTGGSSREYWLIRETLNQRRRVQEEGLRSVNCFSGGITLRGEGTPGIRGCKLCGPEKGLAQSFDGNIEKENLAICWKLYLCPLNFLIKLEYQDA